MGATSEIDHFVDDALRVLHEQLEADAQRALFDRVLDRIDRKLRRMEVKVEKLREGGSVEAAFAAFDLVTSFDKLELLAQELKRLEAHSERRSAVRSYQRQVVPRRNLLGHVRMNQADDGARVLVSRDGASVLTEDDLRELRGKLIDYREAFQEIVRALGEG